MKDKDIQQYKDRLMETSNLKPRSHEQTQELIKLAKEINAYIIPPSGSCGHELYHNIQTHLQTETMINTVKVAKRSCFWAAVAAGLAFLSIIVSQWESISQFIQNFSAK